MQKKLPLDCIQNRQFSSTQKKTVIISNSTTRNHKPQNLFEHRKIFFSEFFLSDKDIR